MKKQKETFKVNGALPRHDKISLTSEKTYFALFREYKKTANPFTSMFGMGEQDESEQWKEPETELSLVAVCKSAKEVASIVRQAPHIEYYVVSGYLTPIQTHSSVFIDGINMDTMTDEWQ